MQITFTIPDGKVARVTDAMTGLFPVPVGIDGQPLYTDGQWAKEKLRRIIINLVYRYESREAQAEAEETIILDDDLVS